VLIYQPTYTLTIIKAGVFGSPTVRGIYRVTGLISGDLSLYVSGAVGQANLVLADPNEEISQIVDPQPMDVIQVALNSPYKQENVVAWTGFVDMVTETYDPVNGRTITLAGSSPWKLWEIVSYDVSAPNAKTQINDAASFALGFIQGIGARDLISLTANRVGFPGALAACVDPENPSVGVPAGLHMYTGLEIVGQRSFSIPDNVFTQPDQQTYSSVLSGIITDTGMELYFDEFGSLIWRPLGYLNTTTPMPLVLDSEIINAQFMLSDQNVATQIRVRWAYDYTQAMDGWAQAPVEMENQLGRRVSTIPTPWIFAKPSADFLAQSLLYQFAANVATGALSCPANPGHRIGTVIQVPALHRAGQHQGQTQYYITGKTYSLTVGGAWFETLMLGYGRAPGQQFPYLPGIPSMTITDAAAAAQIKAGNYADGKSQLSIAPTGQLTAPYPISTSLQIAAGYITGPWPVGTIVRLADANGRPLNTTSQNGEYIVTAQTTSQSGAVVIGGLSVGALPTDAVVTIVKYGDTTGTVTGSGAQGIVTGGGSNGTGGSQAQGGYGGAGGSSSPSTIPQLIKPTAGTPYNPSSFYNPGNTGYTGAFGAKIAPTSQQFTFWPNAGGISVGISQYYGPTTVLSEPPASPPGGQSYAHFHFGIDLKVPYQSPLYAPSSGVVIGVQNDPVPWADGGRGIITTHYDTTGFGPTMVIRTGNLLVLLAHCSSQWTRGGNNAAGGSGPFQVNVGDYVTAGQLVAISGGLPGVDGNTTGPHLHLSVYDITTSFGFVNPLDYFVTAKVL
jgi:murein DD-endopeptidase MepM/ murein hydrolase activator NlpD